MEHTEAQSSPTHLHSVPDLCEGGQGLKLGVATIVDTLMQMSIQCPELFIRAAHHPCLTLHTRERARGREEKRWGTGGESKADQKVWETWNEHRARQLPPLTEAPEHPHNKSQFFYISYITLRYCYVRSLYWQVGSSVTAEEGGSSQRELSATESCGTGMNHNEYDERLDIETTGRPIILFILKQICVGIANFCCWALPIVENFKQHLKDTLCTCISGQAENERRMWTEVVSHICGKSCNITLSCNITQFLQVLFFPASPELHSAVISMPVTMLSSILNSSGASQ